MIYQSFSPHLSAEVGVRAGLSPATDYLSCFHLCRGPLPPASWDNLGAKVSKVPLPRATPSPEPSLN